MAALNDSVIKPVKQYAALTFGATAANSDAIGGSDSLQPYLLVMLTATGAACQVSPFAVSPVPATSDSMVLPLLVPMVFKIRPGHRISAIGLGGASGSLKITQVE